MNSEEAIKSLLSLCESLGARLDSIDRELESKHAVSQRDMARDIRQEAQIQALRSLLAEIVVKIGGSEERAQECFRERFLHYQDVEFREAENISPDVAAHIDTRDESEIPTEANFRPLFEKPD